MSVRRFLLLFLVISMLIPVVGCSSTKVGKGKTILFMTDVGGLEDGSSNDSIYEGLKKAENEFGVDINVVEPQSDDEYASLLLNAKEVNPDVIITLGLLSGNAVELTADKLMDEEVVVIDALVECDNATSITYKVHEGAFLAGVIAGLTSKSGSVGFVGGLEIPSTQAYEYGYKAGFKTVNPQGEVLVNYIGAYNEPELGEEAAIAQNRLGADVIFHASGGSGIGVLKAAKEKGFWTIDIDDTEGSSDSKYVLTSIIKRYDNASFYIADTIVQGNKLPKIVEMGLKEEGIGYVDSQGNVTEDVITKTEELKEDIINGTIQVPYDQITYETYIEENIINEQE